MEAYLFVIAAFIAVAGILIAFKINVEKIKENPDSIEKAQTQLFIGAAMSEAIPIILIVYGFATIEQISNTGLPIFMVILLMAFATFFIFLHSKVDVDEANKQAVNRFSMITIGLVNAIPIISLVFLLMMTV